MSYSLFRYISPSLISTIRYISDGSHMNSGHELVPGITDQIMIIVQMVIRAMTVTQVFLSWAVAMNQGSHSIKPLTCHFLYILF